MLREISPEESYQSRCDLINRLGMALLEEYPGSAYPANTHLANTLWSVLKLWEGSTKNASDECCE